MVKLYPVQFSHFCYIGHPKFNIFDKGCSMKIIAIKKKSETVGTGLKCLIFLSFFVERRERERSTI